MSDYMDIKFQWYNNGIKTIKPGGYISLRQFINAVISPKPEMIQAFEAIKEAGKNGDKKLKDELKTKNLFFTTPSVIVDPIRNYDSIKQFLPFAILEYDGIEYAEELRDYIFEKRKDCIFAFCSPSFTGCKFIFHIETPTSVDNYKELYLGIAHDLDKFKNLDLSNIRNVLPLFNSYDPNAKFREDAIKSVKRGYKINAFIPSTEEIEIPENASEEDKQECFKLIGYLISRIVDCGHNQVVSTAFIGGGVTAYYGVNQDEMWDLIVEKIEENDYLSKGVRGYLTTARTLFNKGLNFPTPLKNREENE